MTQKKEKAVKLCKKKINVAELVVGPWEEICRGIYHSLLDMCKFEEHVSLTKTKWEENPRKWVKQGNLRRGKKRSSEDLVIRC